MFFFGTAGSFLEYVVVTVGRVYMAVVVIFIGLII